MNIDGITSESATRSFPPPNNPLHYTAVMRMRCTAVPTQQLPMAAAAGYDIVGERASIGKNKRRVDPLYSSTTTNSLTHVPTAADTVNAKHMRLCG